MLNRDSALALIETHYAGLLTLLRRKLRDEQLAHDALSQALITSLEHMQAGRIADPSQIAGYVFQVAMNQLRNHRRKMDERPDKRADPEQLDNFAREPEGDQVERSALASRVRALLEELPTPRDRELVKRFYLDEEEKETIRRDLGLSALHFDKVIFRARQRMRSLLEGKGFQRSDFFSLLLVGIA